MATSTNSIGAVDNHENPRTQTKAINDCVAHPIKTSRACHMPQQYQILKSRESIGCTQFQQIQIKRNTQYTIGKIGQQCHRRTVKSFSVCTVCCVSIGCNWCRLTSYYCRGCCCRWIGFRFYFQSK